MKNAADQPDAETPPITEREALVKPPVEGASDATLLVLLGGVIALLLLCIVFVLIAS